MRARLSGIAAEGAVAAVVAAEIGQGEEYLSRISNGAGLETFFGRSGRGEQNREILVRCAEQVTRRLAR